MGITRLESRLVIINQNPSKAHVLRGRGRGEHQKRYEQRFIRQHRFWLIFPEQLMYS